MRQNKSTTLKLLQRFLILVLLACFGMAAHAQDKSISGTILDATGVPMPGVNVIVKGKTISTVSDINGKFVIKSTPGDVLTFSFVGYQSQEITVGAETSLSVTLKEDVQQLNEVVVIGYGVQKKSDLTGAVSSVSVSDMAKTSSNNIVTAMQGKAAGVQISPKTGLPGSETRIRIRGITSLNEKEPLWIIDGVPSGPNSVNPADIESMEILKDAATTAIYGAAGANGVVLVTTKRGTNAKPEANLNIFYGQNQMANQIEVLNGKQFADMNNQLNWIKGAKNGVVDLTQTPTKYNPDTVGNYDWQKGIFRKAATRNIDFNVSGGTEKFSSYFSIGYNETEAIIKNMNWSRLSSRLNSEYKVNDYITVGDNISFNLEKRSGIPEWVFSNEYNSPITEALASAPIQGPYKANAHPDSIWNTSPNGNLSNPMLILDITDEKNNSYSGNGTMYIIISPLKGLRYESRLSSNLSFSNYRNVGRKYYYNASTQNNTINLTKSNYFGQGYNFQNILMYDTKILDNYNIGAMAGSEWGGYYSDNNSAQVKGLMSISNDMLYFGAPTDPSAVWTLPQENASETRGFAYFGRLNLDYKSMILFQGNIRKDYSSIFGPKNRSGIFPGGSLGFKFSELDVVKDFSWLSFGKLRYGIGRSGNNPIQAYSYYSQIGSGLAYSNAQYSFDDKAYQLGAFPINLSNTAIKWETVETTNLGIDLAFFKNKLSVSIDKFTRSNIDMLYLTKTPGAAGWKTEKGKEYFEQNDVKPEPYANIGEFSSKGWEFVAGYKDQIGDLKYEISANVTYVRSRPVNINHDTIYDGSVSRPNGQLSRTIEGQNVGEYYGFKIKKMFKPEDCDTFLMNTSTNISKPRWTKVVRATNQPIKAIKSSFKGINPKNGDSVFSTLSHIDTVYVQNGASAGDYQFEDTNGDGVLNSKDYQALGSAFAPWLYGLTINLEYGWLDLNMVWQGTYGNKIMNARRYQLSNADGQSNWSKDFYDNYYRDAIYDTDGNVVISARTNGTYPRLDPNNANQNLSAPSEFYIEDGSYLRLRSFQFGITVPNTYTKKIGLSNVRVYVGGTNLLTITKYSGMNPEVDISNIFAPGIDLGGFPQPQSITAGISVKF